MLVIRVDDVDYVAFGQVNLDQGRMSRFPQRSIRTLFESKLERGCQVAAFCQGDR